MRVLVVGSCGKRKLYNIPEQPACRDINIKHDINHWKRKLLKHLVPARDMYTGHQNTELVKAIDLLRTITNIEVQFCIVSAGFGMLQEQDLIPPYDCSFTNMSMAEVRMKSQELKLQSSIINEIDNGFDFVYLALGKRYFVALEKDALSKIQVPTILFHGPESDLLIRIPSSAQVVKAFSRRGHKIHGVAGFKGDLLRILVNYALQKRDPSNEVGKWKNPHHLKKLVRRLGGLA
ncbi:MAG: DUF6884 domain-containing protein [Candidatus Thorarchaeota archaeon]